MHARTRLVTLATNPLAIAMVVLLAFAGTTFASESGGGHPTYAPIFAWSVVLLLLARLSGSVERIGLPPVLGELLVGVALGNLALLGLGWFEGLEHVTVIAALAELGVIILLYQVGLESNLQEMKAVGLRAFLVACIGVILPFVLGTYVVGPWLLPGLDFNSYLFLGATLTATSVGITARVFKDLGTDKSDEAKIVLGAAVIDDVLGLLALAIVSAIVKQGSVDPIAFGIISGKAIGFLAIAMIIGHRLANRISSILSKINDGVEMKFTLAIVFPILTAYLAGLIGLAPIVGAFAAGLILDAVHFQWFREADLATELRQFGERCTLNVRAAIANLIDSNNHKLSDQDLIQQLTHCTDDFSSQIRKDVERIADHHADHHIEDFVKQFGIFFVPLFFVTTGMQVQLETLFNPAVLVTALGITAVAVIGKVFAGFAAGGANKWIVGWGMVPRGEVGIIFAMAGKNLGVVNDATFSVIIIMVALTTLITPPILTFLTNRQKSRPKQSAQIEAPVAAV